MALSIRVHATGQAIVVDLTGDADPATLDPLAESLRAALDDGHHVIVHLDHLGPDTHTAEALLAALAALTDPATRPHLHLVASDAVTLDQLRPLAADRSIAVHQSLDEAVHATRTSPGHRRVARDETSAS